MNPFGKKTVKGPPIPLGLYECLVSRRRVGRLTCDSLCTDPMRGGGKLRMNVAISSWFIG
jgi:hypothetical protein